MSIRASSSKHIDALLQDLRSIHAVTREGAIARLMVIGTRAVERLAALAGDRSEATPGRLAALRALEGIGDDRALDAALRAVADPDVTVATAGVGVARTFLTGTEDLKALDALTAVVLNRDRPDAVREAALHALDDLKAATLSPILDALLTDPSSRLRAAAQRVPASETPDATAPCETWLDRIDGDPLPDDVDTIRREIARRGSDVPLGILLRLIERVREREQALPPAEARRWSGARASAHVALATRGSRVALYDLREALQGAREPLPVEFLAALTLIGDASCLESIAAAYANTVGDRSDNWWPRHLADAFQAIVSREGVTRRHAVVKKIDKRWPDARRALWQVRASAR